MPESLRIFISATTDLEAGRAAIGRTLADLPVSLKTEIRRFPKEGTSYETLFEMISNVDRVYFLLGQDITAPSGTEWDLAFRLEREVFALRKPARLTPAAKEFLRTVDYQVTPSEWRLFRTDDELARFIANDVVELLLHPLNRYGLSVIEMERLRLWRKGFGFSAEPHLADEPGGAEDGGIILGRDRESQTIDFSPLPT
ncbi:MAG: hypothetical protein J5I90_04070 [Caldilineales bacterium]|nr:hypothetical protein [Caldilineales bacterium]